MPANHSSAHELARCYGRHLVGHLYSPGASRSPRDLAFALDNGAFPAWMRGETWDGDAFLGLCDGIAAGGLTPLWVLVPDVVASRPGTLERWHEWAPRLRKVYGWPLAFAVQDGMTAADVPPDADVVFVGGSTRWKWQTVTMWCALFKRVHVGRVNTERRLWQCWRLGAETCDGTGWFRGDAKQPRGLRNYLARMRDALGPDPAIEVQNLFGEHDYVDSAPSRGQLATRIPSCRPR
jgi:hypothetical protein